MQVKISFSWKEMLENVSSVYLVLSHGRSRQKNIYFFGIDNMELWNFLNGKKTDFSWIPEIPSMALQNFHFAVQLVSKSSRTVPPNAQYPAQHPAHCTIFPVNSRSNITLRCISHIKRSRRQKSAAIDDRRFGCFARKLPATNFLFELTRWLSVCVHVYTNQARVPRLPQ